MKDEFTQNMKNIADEERIPSVANLLLNDEEYLMSVSSLNKAEKMFNELNLTETQKEVIKNYLQIWDDIYSDYSTYSYIAGVKNTLNNKTALS